MPNNYNYFFGRIIIVGNNWGPKKVTTDKMFLAQKTKEHRKALLGKKFVGCKKSFLGAFTV